MSRDTCGRFRVPGPQFSSMREQLGFSENGELRTKKAAFARGLGNKSIVSGVAYCFGGLLAGGLVGGGVAGLVPGVVAGFAPRPVAGLVPPADAGGAGTPDFRL